MRATRGTTRWRQGLAALTAALVASAGLSVVTARADVVWPPTPTEIPNSPPDSDNPQVASLGANGDAVAVWATCGCVGAGVQAAVYDGSTWSTAQPISTMGAADAFEPQIAATSPGHAIAVWTQEDATTHKLTIQVRTYGPGGWGTPFPVSGTTTDVDSPQIAGGTDGTAAAVWTNYDLPSPNSDIQAATFDGGTWSAPQTLTDSASTNGVPQVAVSGSGAAMAVWTSGPGCGCSGTIRAAAFTAATSSLPENLSPPGEESSDPIVAATGGGTAVAAWVKNIDGPNALVQARAYAGSSPWGSVEPVSDPTEDVFPLGPPQITSTAAGRATVVWSGPNAALDSVVFASQRAGGTWSTRVALSTPLPSSDGALYFTPDITTVEPGVALAVWQASDLIAGTATLQAATYDGSTVTGPANVAVTKVAPFLALPQVAGTGDGTAVTVWVNDDGLGTLSIQSALGAPSAVTKPGPGGDATLSTSAGGFLHVKHSAVPASPAPPAGVQFPYGLLSFDIVNLPTPGASATVTVTLPGPVTQYWKLQHDTWTQLTNATFSTNHVSFTLTDGGIGDADGVANSVIVDPGAPAVVLPRITFTG